MSQLVAIVYPDQFRAAEALAKIHRLEASFQLNLADACCVTKDADGNVKLHQTFNVTSAGAINGALWGTLIGVVLLNPLLGLAAGTAAGAVVGRLSDHGIPDRFMRDLGEKMTPGSSAIFLLIRMANSMEKVEQTLAEFGGHVLYTDLKKETAEHLESLLVGDSGKAP